jgi:hypothetical protein
MLEIVSYKKLVVIKRDDDTPTYIDIEYKPMSGILMKDDSLLIIGCYDGYL